MNAIRSAITVFLLVLVALSVAGWVWAGHQPPAYPATAARVVLAVCGVGGLAAVYELWLGTRRPAH